MNQPIFSVIIPCYNHGAYLEQAIKSVENNSYQNYEIIIINDGSTDQDTIIKLNELQQKGYRVIFQENKGASNARNNGIKRAIGKYILPLDADNWIASDFVSKSIGAMERDSSVDIVYTDKYFVKGASVTFKKVGAFDLSRLLKGNYVDTCAVFRKSVWEKTGGYSEQTEGMEDYEFWLSAVEHQCRFHYIAKPLYYYRILENSKIRTLNKNKLNDKTKEKIYLKHAKLIIPYYMRLLKLSRGIEYDSKYPLRASFKYLYKWIAGLFKSDRPQ